MNVALSESGREIERHGSLLGSESVRDIAALCIPFLILSGALLFDIGNRHAAYLRDVAVYVNADAEHYVLLGRNLFLHHAYSRANAPPYVPDALRTPVFPLIAGGLTVLFDSPLPIYVLQVLLHAALIASIYLFCRRAFNRTVALVAGFFVAGDLALAVGNLEAMSEPLFVFLETAGVLVWVYGLRCELEARRRGLVLALAGVLLGLATLTRPAGQFLPAGLALLEIVRLARQKNWRVIRQVSFATALSYAIVIPWGVRNYLEFGIPRMTYVDSVDLVHFVGGSAYAVHHGTSLDEAQSLLESKYQLPSFRATFNYWKFGLEPREIDLAYRAVVREVVTQYPLAVVQSSLMGMTKALFGNNVATYAEMTNRPWKGGGLSHLTAGRLGEFAAEMSSRSPLLTALFFWQLAHASVVVSGAVAGSIVALRCAETRSWAGILLVVMLYHLAMIGAIGMDATARFRFPVTPLACVFAALGTARAYEMIRRKGSCAPRSA